MNIWKKLKANNFYDKLDEMKVTVDENDLVQSFKYVAMDVDDDEAIFILSKIKKSLYIIKEHGRFHEYDVDADIQKVERFLEIAWSKRGHFPGFNIVANLLAGNESGRKRNYTSIIEELKSAEGDQYYEKVLDLLNNDENIPDYLDALEQDINDSKRCNIRLWNNTGEFFKIINIKSQSLSI